MPLSGCLLRRHQETKNAKGKFTMAKKKLGAGLSLAGTGSVAEANGESGVSKWSQAASASLTVASDVKPVNSKILPLSLISTDKDNPRKLAISQEEVSDFASKHPLTEEVWSDPVALESYIEETEQSSGFTGKALADLLSLIEFAASIKKAERLINPIMVRQIENSFIVIAGERRFLAHILLGTGSIKSNINSDQVMRNEIDLIQWEENEQREDMSLYEKLDRVKKIIEASTSISGTSISEVQALIGKSRAMSQRYLVILRYPTNTLYNAIKDGRVSDLQAAAKLAQLTDDELQKKLNGEKPAKKSQVVNVSKTADIDSLRTLIVAAATQLNIGDALNDLKLTSNKDVTAALELLMKRVGEMKRG